MTETSSSPLLLARTVRNKSSGRAMSNLRPEMHATSLDLGPGSQLIPLETRCH